MNFIRTRGLDFYSGSEALLRINIASLAGREGDGLTRGPWAARPRPRFVGVGFLLFVGKYFKSGPAVARTARRLCHISVARWI